jgi:hypothetical protein
MLDIKLSISKLSKPREISPCLATEHQRVKKRKRSKALI